MHLPRLAIWMLLPAMLAACSPQPAGGAAASPASAVVLHPESGLEVIPLKVTSGGKVHTFRVEVARSDDQWTRGLMFRKAMGADEGMVFVGRPPSFASFWMRNTLIPLDIIFIGTDNKVINIEAMAEPETLDPRRAQGLTLAVLELNGGRAAQLGIAPGDRVEW